MRAFLARTAVFSRKSGALRKEYSAVSATHTTEWLNRLTIYTKVVADGLVEIFPEAVGTVVRLVKIVA